jgi:hypothetical protein
MRSLFFAFLIFSMICLAGWDYPDVQDSSAVDSAVDVFTDRNDSAYPNKKLNPRNGGNNNGPDAADLQALPDEMPEGPATEPDRIDIQALPDELPDQSLSEPDITKKQAFPKEWYDEDTQWIADLENHPQFYQGAWLRQGTYVNGESQNSVPALLLLKDDSYISKAGCTARGHLDVRGNTMTMSVNYSDCPGKAIPSLTFTCFISEDAGQMLLSTKMMGSEVKEFYKRTDLSEEEIDITELQAIPDELPDKTEPEHDITETQALTEDMLDDSNGDITDTQALTEDMLDGSNGDITDTQALTEDMLDGSNGDITDTQALTEDMLKDE